jgi:hypothetical protein
MMPSTAATSRKPGKLGTAKLDLHRPRQRIAVNRVLVTCYRSGGRRGGEEELRAI